MKKKNDSPPKQNVWVIGMTFLAVLAGCRCRNTLPAMASIRPLGLSGQPWRKTDRHR